MTNQAGIDFWTPERIQQAVAEPSSFPPVGKPRVKEAVAAPPQFVPEEDLTKFPFQSVGRLFYTKAGQLFSGSAAFTVASDNAIFTAAHVLISQMGAAQDLLFIPAMKDSNDTMGQNFGRFPQIPGGQGVAWAVDRNWDPNNPNRAYDMGAVKLGLGSRGQMISAVLQTINVLANQQNTDETEWLTIGYPTQPDNPTIRMMMQEGSFKSQAAGIVNKFGDGLHGGASGGPWLRAGVRPAAMNGLHSGTDEEGDSSASPYFTLEMQTALLSLFRE